MVITDRRVDRRTSEPPSSKFNFRLDDPQLQAIQTIVDGLSGVTAKSGERFPLTISSYDFPEHPMFDGETTQVTALGDTAMIKTNITFVDGVKWYYVENNPAIKDVVEGLLQRGYTVVQSSADEVEWLSAELGEYALKIGFGFRFGVSLEEEEIEASREVGQQSKHDMFLAMKEDDYEVEAGSNEEDDKDEEEDLETEEGEDEMEDDGEDNEPDQGIFLRFYRKSNGTLINIPVWQVQKALGLYARFYADAMEVITGAEQYKPPEVTIVFRPVENE